MRTSLFILAAKKPKMNTSTATDVRLLIATEVELMMHSFILGDTIAEIYFRYQIAGIIEP